MKPRWAIVLLAAALSAKSLLGQGSQTQSPAAFAKPAQTRSPSSRSSANQSPDAGSVAGGLYRNPTFGFTCKIPEAWVLRTDEMNAPDGETQNQDAGKPAKNATGTARVLLAVFSRPPQAHGDDINSSILIAAESVLSYPGLTIAAQYMATVAEIAKAQGLEAAEEPYEIAVGAKTLARGDFQKNVGARVMHQSTLVMLSHGYAVSFTFIGGTQDEVEELVEGLVFTAGNKSSR